MGLLPWEKREVVDRTGEARASCRKDEESGLEHAEPDALGEAETAPALETQAQSSVQRPDLEDFTSAVFCPLRTGDAQGVGTVVPLSLVSPLAL